MTSELLTKAGAVVGAGVNNSEASIAGEWSGGRWAESGVPSGGGVASPERPAWLSRDEDDDDDDDDYDDDSFFDDDDDDNETDDAFFDDEDDDLDSDDDDDDDDL